MHHNLVTYGKEFGGLNDNEVKYKSTNHERDEETGLDNRGARFSDCEHLRFLSVDPKEAEYPSMSSYNYVGGNPIQHVDANGKNFDDYYMTTSGGYLGERTVAGSRTDNLYIVNPSNNSVRAGYLGYNYIVNTDPGIARTQAAFLDNGYSRKTHYARASILFRIFNNNPPTVPGSNATIDPRVPANSVNTEGVSNSSNGNATINYANIPVVPAADANSNGVPDCVSLGPCFDPGSESSSSGPKDREPVGPGAPYRPLPAGSTPPTPNTASYVPLPVGTNLQPLFQPNLTDKEGKKITDNNGNVIKP